MCGTDLFVETELPQPFSLAELNDSFQKMKNGDASAREAIIVHNIRFVISEVRTKFAHTFYEQKELIAVGMLGLIKSVDTFDINKGAAYATYASHCIDNEILMFMRKNDKHIHNESFESLAHLEESKETRLFESPFSFVDNYLQQESYKKIGQIISQLPEKESEVIQKYFGFETDNPQSQTEIARSLGLSQSYISRMIRKTLGKISLELQQEDPIESCQLVKKRNYKNQ